MNPEEVTQLAMLAKLSVEEEDLKAIAHGLSDMQSFFAQIQAAQTDDVIEEIFPAQLRPDEIQPSLLQNQALHNRGQDGYFLFETQRRDVP